MTRGALGGRHRRTRRGRRAVQVTSLVTAVCVALAWSLSGAETGTGTPYEPEADLPRSPDPSSVMRPRVAPSPSAARPREVPPAEASGRTMRIPVSGPGEFSVAGRDVAVASVESLDYTVEVERSLPFAVSDVATQIRLVLQDSRGWTAVNETAFQQVAADPDLRVLVATPSTTDRLCAPLKTRGRVSCRNGDLVVINARRWAFGVPDYRGRLRDYRRYVVNHEVGHALGEDHVECPGQGRPAPVMLQQTYGLDGCRRNPWPSIA